MQPEASDASAGLRYAGLVTEPATVATDVQQVVPGVWTWSVHDDRIDFVSASYAVSSEEGTTTSSHQRSAWRLRRALGARVWAPALARQVEEEPDERYSEDDALPARLRPIFTPGAGTTQHTFLLDRNGGVAFVPDLFVLPPGGELTLVPEQYAHDVEQARRSVEKLLQLPFAALCLGHGAPVLDDPKARMRAALESRTANPSDASGWET
jgi:glyoxylase-like metal-dependent hydrolase (beta-lactamase superfamily II)